MLLHTTKGSHASARLTMAGDVFIHISVLLPSLLTFSDEVGSLLAPHLGIEIEIGYCKVHARSFFTLL